MSQHGVMRLALVVIGFAGALAATGPLSPLGAQTVTNSFGGMSKNSNEPIDIESDMLTVFDAKKIATFKGDVRAVQGTTTLRAGELNVHYIGGAGKLAGQRGEDAVAAKQEAQAKGDDPQTNIKRLEARGNVVITSEDDQTTSSDWAIYDVAAQLVTVGGNVVLSQGENVLKGNRLIIDLQTGESRFENTGTAATGGGRIRALFMPKGSNAKDGAAKKRASEAQGRRAPEAARETGEPPIAPTRR